MRHSLRTDLHLFNVSEASGFKFSTFDDNFDYLLLSYPDVVPLTLSNFLCLLILPS